MTNFIKEQEVQDQVHELEHEEKAEGVEKVQVEEVGQVEVEGLQEHCDVKHQI